MTIHTVKQYGYDGSVNREKNNKIYGLSLNVC